MQDGPIHDAQWSPDGAFFIVVAGFMPAKTVLFDAKCKPVFDLGTGPYNIIRWNPQVAALVRSIGYCVQVLYCTGPANCTAELGNKVYSLRGCDY